MKKLISLILTLALVVCLLSGCVASLLQGEKTITVEGLSITVPNTYIDMKDIVNNDDLAFVYGFGNDAVLAIKESIASVKAVAPEVDTTTEYAKLFLRANNLTSTMADRDGIPTFTYSASVGTDSFTYLCGAFSDGTNFWMVQAYCYTKDFAEMEADLWKMVKSVSFS